MKSQLPSSIFLNFSSSSSFSSLTFCRFFFFSLSVTPCVLSLSAFLAGKIRTNKTDIDYRYFPRNFQMCFVLNCYQLRPLIQNPFCCVHKLESPSFLKYFSGKKGVFYVESFPLRTDTCVDISLNYVTISSDQPYFRNLHYLCIHLVHLYHTRDLVNLNYNLSFEPCI